MASPVPFLLWPCRPRPLPCAGCLPPGLVQPTGAGRVRQVRVCGAMGTRSALTTCPVMRTICLDSAGFTRLCQDFARTLQGLRHAPCQDYARTSPGLRQDFARASPRLCLESPGLCHDFPRTSPRLRERRESHIDHVTEWLRASKASFLLLVCPAALNNENMTDKTV